MSTSSSRTRRRGTGRRTAVLLAAVLPLLATGTAGAEEAPAREAATAPAGTGFEGRVAIDGQVLPGARVYAYGTFEDFLAHRPAAASGVTTDDGSWRIDLPRGSYYLVAKKRADGPEDGPVRAGDYLTYHGSNPIVAVTGTHTHVGFSMEKLEADVAYEDVPGATSGSLSGVVTSGGYPLEGASVFLYSDARGDFRGAGHAALPPTGGSGRFRIDNLPEGNYFVVVRKRAGKKIAGPIADGDHFGFFGANPVRVRAGKAARIRVAAVAKASEIGKDDSLFRETGTRVTGRVVDRGGRAVGGVYAFAYEDRSMSLRRPVAISRETDAEGRFTLNLPRGGVYYLGARSNYGDTPTPGEWYGRYAGTADHSVSLATGSALAGIDIMVERIPP